MPGFVLGANCAARADRQHPHSRASPGPKRPQRVGGSSRTKLGRRTKVPGREKAVRRGAHWLRWVPHRPTRPRARGNEQAAPPPRAGRAATWALRAGRTPRAQGPRRLPKFRIAARLSCAGARTPFPKPALACGPRRWRPACGSWLGWPRSAVRAIAYPR